MTCINYVSSKNVSVLKVRAYKNVNFSTEALRSRIKVVSSYWLVVKTKV